MNEVLKRQLAIDYCCTPEEVADRENHFTLHRYLDGRRRFQEDGECFLKAAVINGKVLFTGEKNIVEWCRDAYRETDGAWFLEAGNMRKLDERLRQDGFQISQAHPFYISEKMDDVDTDGYTVCWYRGNEIEQFRGDGRYNEAFVFCEEAPDVIGVSAGKDGMIFGMAGASADSPTMWQIGINVNKEYRRAGIGKMLVTLLKNEILKQGILPYYGTSFSHIASQRVALDSGFKPVWTELVTAAIQNDAGSKGHEPIT